MMNWEFLIQEKAIASVLPEEYLHFARPIRDGLSVFLEGLPDEHQTTIFAKQAALPAGASMSERLGVLAQSCPVLHKLGQVLARDQRLCVELRRELRQLESLPPTVPLETIQELLARELGPLDRRGVALNPPAIAEASVAVVIPFTRVDGRHGVFKILKPGIEGRLELELNLLDRVGEHLDSRCDELQIPQLDYRESFQQVRDKLWQETKLDREQQQIERARLFYQNEPDVLVPALFEHCTPRVTAMQRVTGGKVTDHPLTGTRDKRRLAKRIVKALIARPIFSRDSLALFHSDPHAGNLFFTDDRRLAILDWSLVGTLGEPQRAAIVQVLIGAVTLDPAKIVRVLEELAERQADRGSLESIAHKWVGQVRRGTFPGLGWLIGLLDDAVQNARLRVAADLLLFRKTLHTLEGVVAEVGASNCYLDQVLCVEFLRNFAAEWPQRWFSFPDSRAFATRLSNIDLTGIALKYPATLTRFWTGHTLDLLDQSSFNGKPQATAET